MILTKTVSTDLEIKGILELQRKNLELSISPEELEEEGFVTVEHSYALLKKMNQELPGIVTLDNDRIIAYSLCMSKVFRNDIAVLIPMFDLIDSLQYRSKDLSQLEYVIGGQVCIDKEYRSKGIFYDLYNHAKKTYMDRFPLMLTEVSRRNPRSVKAHLNCGFEIIHEYDMNEESWLIMAWNWSI